MVKPKWGLKRHCQACGVSFYDLHHSPIICPKCNAKFDPEAGFKPRRSRGAAANEKEKSLAASEGVSKVIEDVAKAKIDDAGDSTETEDNEKNEGIITDASELGGNEDDVSEVVSDIESNEDKC